MARYGIIMGSALLSGLCSTAAFAEGTYIGMGAGTTGIGPEIGLDINDNFGLRVNSGYLKITRDIDVDDIKYHGTATLGSIAVLADFYPFKGGFRVGAGGYYNKNKIDITATPAIPVSIGNNTYTPAQVGRLDGSVKFNDFAPYAGLGFSTNRGGKGFAVTGDLGVMFQGSPKVSLSGAGTIASTPGFQADLERERQRISDDIDKYKLFPVIRGGVAYRF